MPSGTVTDVADDGARLARTVALTSATLGSLVAVVVPEAGLPAFSSFMFGAAFVLLASPNNGSRTLLTVSGKRGFAAAFAVFFLAAMTLIVFAHWWWGLVAALGALAG